MKSFRFYVKLIIKNPVFYATILLNFYFFYFLYFALQTSSVEYVTFTYYLNIMINLALLFLGYYYAINNRSVHLFYERDVLKKGIVLVGSLLLVNLVFICMNAIYIYLFGQYFVFKGILYLAILFTISSLLSGIIGVSSGLIFKKLGAIMIPLVFYGLFIFSSLTYEPPFSTFFNLYADNLRMERNSFISIPFNLSFWLDKLFILGISTILLFLALAIVTKKRRLKLISFMGIISFILLNIFIMNKSNAIQQKQQYEMAVIQNNGFKINNYKMELTLKKRMENHVTVDLKTEKELSSINLYLNQSYKIESVQLNSLHTPFTFKEGMLTIPTTTEKNEKLRIQIQYSGEVYVENMNYPIIYTTSNSVSLPGFRFAWYPQNKQKTVIPFEVTVKSKSKVYSTLTKSRKNHFTGLSSTVSLFASPLYKDEQYRGKNYHIPNSYLVNLTLPNFKKEKNWIKDSQLSAGAKKRVIDGDYKEILVIPRGLLDDGFMLIDNALLLSVIE